MKKTEFKSKLKGHYLNGQSREIVTNVLEFMRNEKESKMPINLTKVNHRVSMATGVSERSINRLSHQKLKIELGECSKYKTPKTGIKPKSVANIGDFKKGILKRIILNMYVREEGIPSINSILHKFKEETGFVGCRETLRTIIKSIGFKWRMVKGSRKMLTESYDSRMKRIHFLRCIESYRREDRPIVYFDQTYLYPAGFTKNGNEPSGDRSRITVLHAGGQTGFIPNSLLFFKPDDKTENRPIHMTFDVYSKWIEEKLVPNLPERSVLVLINSPYYHKQSEKPPNEFDFKYILVDWLRGRNIPANLAMLKPDLYQLILQYQPKYKTYAIDDILRKFGHDVLRLPPHYPDLNPMDLIWTTLKDLSQKQARPLELEVAKNLCEEFIRTFSSDDWQSLCERAKSFEKEFLSREAKIDEVVDKFKFSDESSDQTTEESEDDLDEDDL